MRRELILVLLGIVCISTLTSYNIIIPEYMLTVPDKILLDVVMGAVGAGNFSFWQLGHNGPLFIQLTSLTGDADLYVSDSIRPSYEIDKNNFSSVTCGPDIVHIPNDFPRPIGIGVFGDWSHALSEYSIHVFLDASSLLNEQLLAEEKSHQTYPERSENNQGAKEKVVAKKIDEEKPKFLKLLNILDMIFEMFVL